MKKNIFVSVLLCLLLMSVKTLQAQSRGINVAFSVTPPYSSKLSDYASMPGKTIITLTNPASATGAPARVYLRLNITGDNGIKISTKAGYRPSQPILVPPNVPTMVDLQTINALFDVNSFDFVGITARQIVAREGLPEGNYQLCVRAYNFDSPELPASAEAPAGCVFIRLTQLEPPLLIKPFDKENIRMGASTVQNIIFSWNIPAGAEPGTEYLLRVIEMLDPNKNPNDAMNSRTTPAFFETITNTNIFLYGPAQPALVPGRKYAWAVTAAPNARVSAYRNGGRSEVRSFIYGGASVVASNRQLGFILPNSKDPVLKINNQQDMMLSWNFLQTLLNNQTITDTAYKQFGVNQYDLSITAGTESKTQKVDKAFSYKTSFKLHNDTLEHVFRKTGPEADALGFKDGHWYKATITAKGTGGNTIQSATSIDFQYTKETDDEPVFITKVKAQLKYTFEGKPGQYDAANTPVEVQVFKKLQQKSVKGLVIETFNSTDYNLVASATQETNATGEVEVSVKIPQTKFGVDSFYYKVKMNGAYYIYSHFGLMAAKAVAKDTAVNFGQLVAKTYGYSLKLNVTKAYPNYFVTTDSKGNLSINVDTSKFSQDFTYNTSKGGMTYKSNLAKPEAGLTLIIFRKNKKGYVPPVEGNLAAGTLKTGYVEVGREKTQIEKMSDGTERAVVQFNNLLTNLFEGDEYYVIALNAANKPLADESFIASEMSVRVAKPTGKELRSDSLYRALMKDYTIISKKAPTSLVKGKLIYKWGSEGTKAQLRPVSNQKFKVVVDYLVDNQSIGSVKENTSNAKKMGYSEKFFVPDGQDEYSDGQQLLDFDQTMATGKTDAQGNFEIEVVNFNKKGDLGKGRIVEQGWSVDNPDPKTKPANPLDMVGKYADPVINPWDGAINNAGTYNSMPGGNYGYQQTGLFNLNSQGALNAGMNGGFGFNASSGFFEAGLAAGAAAKGVKGVKGAMGGMGMVMDGVQQEVALRGPAMDEDFMQYHREPLQKVERVYRIIPDNDYLDPATETFTVQAFEAKSLPVTNSLVKETTIKVTATDNNKNILPGMLVTIFRPIGQKPVDLPFGEGDGKYLQKELTNPQYKGNDAAFDEAAKKIKNSNLFTSKFEILLPEQTTGGDGTTSLRHVLYGYPYYIMACSNPADGAQFFKATFVQNAYGDPTIVLEAMASRALIRTQDNSTQKELPYGAVYVNNKYTTFTDGAGYAELKGSQLPGLSTTKGTKLYFHATASGYKNSPASSFTFNAVGQQFVKALNLDPAAVITGNLVSKDEKNKAVKAYIKSSAGKTVETDATGYFSIPVPALANEKLEVIPKDVAYFDSTLVLSGATGSRNYKDFPVYRRKHRILIRVKDMGNKATLGSAVVRLGDTEVTASANGEAKFEFENVSVNNYTFIVKGANGTNYIPVTKNVKNEESKTFITVPVELEKGSEVSGTVTLDNKPVKNARVYVEASNKQSGNSKDANLLVAYSNAQGKYTLNGIPVNNSKLNIIATLDTTFTVNGDNKVADIKNNAAVTNLALTTYADMAITNVFGFPLSVEKITPTGTADEVKVTGVIKWSNALSDFKWIQGNDVLRVEDVVFKAKTVNGKKVGEVKANSVDIEDAASFKLRYLDKYNVKLYKKQDFYFPGSPVDPLSITKENDYGVIRGKINIVDNSFNYPSTYINFTKKDQFYLATVDGSTVNSTVSAVSSAVKSSTANNGLYTNYSDLVKNIESILVGNNSSSKPPVKLYNLSNASGGNIAFKFIEFDATADARNSYIAKDGKLHLNVKMHCKIANAYPDTFSVNVNDVVLDDNKVYASSSNSPLEVTLEKWTLLVKDWTLSPQEGGIVSHNGLIRTSKLDIPFKNFNLRHDMYFIDSFQVNNLKIGGGIKTLDKINASNAALVFDNKTGTDMKAHWRFSMSSTGNPVATLSGLPDLGGEVGIDYIQLLSNEQNVFQLKDAKVPLLLYGNSIAKFTPQSIGNGPDFFTITGALNIGAPRAGDMSLDLKFMKESGVLKMKTGNVKTDIEGKGFVHFTSIDGANNVANIRISSDSIKITGEVVEKPSKSFNPAKATLIATTAGPGVGNYKIDLDKNQVMQLTSAGSSASSGYKLTIDKGGMSVVNKDWDILTYSGTMESNSNNADKGIKPTYMTFKVLGDISVDADSAKMDNINTPFGKMTMMFDFGNKRLIGTLKLNKVQLGTNLVSGTVETLFDPKGFYVAGGGTADVVVGNPIVDGTYNLGFMIGSYPLSAPGDHLWQTVTAYKQAEVKNDCYVSKLGGRLKGFYMTADRIVLDKSAEFDFILISGYVKAKAILGADLYANFSGQTAMGVAAYVYAHGAAGMSALTGTSLNGSAEARAAAIMEYAGGKFNLDAKIDVSFTAKVEQFLLLGTVSASKSVGASATAGTSGFSLSLNSGNQLPKCY